MPSKKKGRAPGRAAMPEQLSRADDMQVPSCSSSSSKVATHLIDVPPSPSTSSSAMAKALREEPVSSLRNHRASASSTAAVEFDDEPSADDFQDALEELVPDESQDESQEEPAAALLKKDASLQKPAPARSDWDAELQALQQLMQNAEVTDDEKVRVLHEALSQRIEDVRGLEEHRTAMERSSEELIKERERCKKETAQSLVVKAKLEDSCRELQQLKINITQENKKIIEDEKERQAELNDKFQAAMKDVEEKMKAETEVREHFIKENEELRTKLDKFTDTYEEQERQLAEQTAVRTEEMEAARERLKEYETKSKESESNATALEKKNKALQKTTVALRAELQSILGKFDEFHESVNGSNQKHGECKTEIDGLSARLKDLDDENKELKENTKMNELTKEKEQLQKQRDALERLCGNLQGEIVKIRERIKAPGKKGGC